MAIWTFRHPFVEGEGTGSASDRRNVTNELSDAGKAQVNHILNFLQRQPEKPSVVISPSEPRYHQLAQAIAAEFQIQITTEDRLCQDGGRTTGEERVLKLTGNLSDMLAILATAPDKAVIITSNPLLECLQYQRRPITFQEMETEGGKKKYRVNPGCGLELQSNGDVVRRLDLFDKEGKPLQVE